MENGRRRGSEGGGCLRLVKTGPSHPCRLRERPYHTRRTCEGSHSWGSWCARGWGLWEGLSRVH